jgi:ABC-2 type transport system permease protein
MNAWQITKKDLRLLVRDRRTLAILVLLPMAFISILGLSTGQLFSEKDKARQIKVGVVREDDSPAAGKLLTEVYKLKALELREFDDRPTGREQLSEGRIDVLVFIGPDYHKRVEELDLADIFYGDEGRLAGKLAGLDIQVMPGAFLANAGEIIEELVFAFSQRTIAPDVLKQREPEQARKLFLKAKSAALEREKEQSKEAAAPQSAGSPSRASFVYQILVPSYTVMFVFFIVNFMARSFIGERDMGTLNRLRIAPITRTGLLLGKTVPFLALSMVQTGLLFAAGRLIFGMSWGPDPLLLLPVMLGTSMAATSLGLLVATLVRNDAQVSAYANSLVLIMAAVSGCLMPRSWQPELMQQLGLITPHAWALIAYDQLLNRDAPVLSVVWESCLVLWAFTLAFFGIGWWRFRRLD